MYNILHIISLNNKGNIVGQTFNIHTELIKAVEYFMFKIPKEHIKVIYFIDKFDVYPPKKFIESLEENKLINITRIIRQLGLGKYLNIPRESINSTENN